MNLFSLIPRSWKEYLRHRAGAITVRARLNNLREAGFSPRRIIDAGAFMGEWTELAHSIYPSAELLLIEPQPHLTAKLEALCRRLPVTASVRPVLLSSQSGRATFRLQESNSQIVPPDHKPVAGERLIEVEMATLADLVANTEFAQCDLIKLDLQGHELEALAGAGELFGRAEVIFIEVSWLRIGDVPIAEEVIARFTQKGYRLYDVLGFNHRPLDRALWQTDFIFVRNDSALISSRDWA